jgi:tetratricopeptide (TPR) repeat protein
MKRTDDAEATYQRAVAARPDDWLSANVLAVFHLGRSRLDEAEAGFRRVIELTPDNTRGYNNLGVVLFRRDRVADAVATWERSMQIRPTFTAASNLGTQYFGAGRYADSARAFERAVELAPNDRRVWRNLGAALYNAPGERAKAAAAFEKALELAEAERAINPREPSVVAEIADSASMLGRREATLDAIRAIERMDPSDADDLFMVAVACEQIGDRTPALKWLEKALANGYDRRRVESSPSLTALRKDPRYADLVTKFTH